jgi:dehydrogenase/reductase SDR family protein 1
VPDLTGRVALVTGASRGVGKGVALALGEAGAHVYITARTLSGPGSLEATEACFDTLRGECLPVQCDHRDDAQTASAFSRIRREHGALDLLVNNAWGGYENMVVDGDFTWSRPFWEQPLWRWDAMFDVGVRTAFACARLAAHAMIDRNTGLIVNICDWTAQKYQGKL